MGGLPLSKHGDQLGADFAVLSDGVLALEPENGVPGFITHDAVSIYRVVAKVAQQHLGRRDPDLLEREARQFDLYLLNECVGLGKFVEKNKITPATLKAHPGALVAKRHKFDADISAPRLC